MEGLDEARLHQFEDRVADVLDNNTAPEIRKEIDAYLGESSWDGVSTKAGWFNKRELAILLLALGG